MRVFTRVTSLIRDCFDIRQASFDLPSQNLRRECCGQGPRRPWHVLPPTLASPRMYTSPFWTPRNPEYVARGDGFVAFWEAAFLFFSSPC